MAGKSSIFQPDHAGRATPQVQTSTIAHVHDRSHEHAAMQGSNMARAGGKPKGGVVQTHGGMTRQQTDMAGLGGLGHATGADANPGTNPLGGAPRGKTFAPAQPVPGQRSRIMNDDLHGGSPGVNHARAASRNGNLDHDLGRAILDEAFAASSPDDRRAHGRG